MMPKISCILKKQGIWYDKPKKVAKKGIRTQKKGILEGNQKQFLTKK